MSRPAGVPRWGTFSGRRPGGRLRGAETGRKGFFSGGPGQPAPLRSKKMRKEIVQKISNLPALPAILAKIVSTIDDPNSSAEDLENIIRYDMVLTGKLLAAANSAYYSFRQEITTVSRAVVAIGFEEVRNLCVGICMMGFLHPTAFKNRERAQSLWLHSLAVAEGAALLAENTTEVKPDQAYAAGLLHDIGKVVIEAFFPNEVEALKYMVEKKRIPYREAEEQLEIQHDKIGLMLARNWKMPAMLREAVGKHHNMSGNLDYFQMVPTVHMADYLVHILNFSSQYRVAPPEVHPLALEALGLGKAQLKKAGLILNGRREKIISVWNKLVDND